MVSLTKTLTEGRCQTKPQPQLLPLQLLHPPCPVWVDSPKKRRLWWIQTQDKENHLGLPSNSSNMAWNPTQMMWAWMKFTHVCCKNWKCLWSQCMDQLSEPNKRISPRQLQAQMGPAYGIKTSLMRMTMMMKMRKMMWRYRKKRTCHQHQIGLMWYKAWMSH